jgi:hypothetical protein
MLARSKWRINCFCRHDEKKIIIPAMDTFHAHSFFESLSLPIQPKKAAITITQKAIVVSKGEIINFFPIIANKGMNEK